MKKHSGIKIKTLSVLVTSGLLLSAMLVIFSANIILNEVRKAGGTWDTYATGPAAKAAILSELKEILGYDGMIHHYKNFVLRKDRMLIIRAEAALLDIAVNLTAYESLGVTKKEKQALAVLVSRLDKYQDALALAESMAAAGAAPSKIDRAVRVNDALAVEAMEILEAELQAALETSSSQVAAIIAEAKNVSTITTLGAALVLVSIIGAVFWLLHIRLLRPLDRLGGVMSRLAAGDVAAAVPETARRDEIGDMARTVSVFRTAVSERKDVEKALVQAREQAVAADHAKSEFLANMSHELRTPLNAVIGFSEIIKGQVFGPLENEKYLEYVESIYGSGQHLLALVNDILDVTAIEKGRILLKEEAVSLVDVANECVQQLANEADRQKVLVENLIGEKIPMVEGDRLRLRQVLLNLAINAVKFTPESGMVTLDARLNAEREIIISVTDTGIGIAPENLSAALSPFGQVDRDAYTTGEGAGLGLFLCRLFTEMHGGTLEIESAPGAGTRAMIRLPAERVISEAA